jgi:hypothetical protein
MGDIEGLEVSQYRMTHQHAILDNSSHLCTDVLELARVHAIVVGTDIIADDHVTHVFVIHQHTVVVDNRDTCDHIRVVRFPCLDQLAIHRQVICQLPQAHFFQIHGGGRRDGARGGRAGSGVHGNKSVADGRGVKVGRQGSSYCIQQGPSTTVVVVVVVAVALTTAVGSSGGTTGSVVVMAIVAAAEDAGGGSLGWFSVDVGGSTLIAVGIVGIRTASDHHTIVIVYIYIAIAIAIAIANAIVTISFACTTGKRYWGSALIQVGHGERMVVLIGDVGISGGNHRTRQTHRWGRGRGREVQLHRVIE